MESKAHVNDVVEALLYDIHMQLTCCTLSCFLKFIRCGYVNDVHFIIMYMNVITEVESKLCIKINYSSTILLLLFNQCFK